MAEDYAPQDEAVLELARAVMPVISKAVDEGRNVSEVLMALAVVVGEVLAAATASAEHLEEGLEIFAGLTGDHARGTYLTQLEKAGAPDN